MSPWGQFRGSPYDPFPRTNVPTVPPHPSPVPSPFQPRPSASPTLALAGWCPLSPTGAQTTQLLVEPPWTPAVLWDRVTLTCQGSGTAGATTWYKDGQRWGQEGQHRFTVTESGTYTCDRPGSGHSPPVRVLDGEGGLGVPSLAPPGTPGALGTSMWDIRAPTSAWPPTSWDRTGHRCSRHSALSWSR
uniref:Uncharacterized protein n=1 Tax=Geospiza parvula TaxID=87175 RepID=A0A8C3NFE2_GEOPR